MSRPARSAGRSVTPFGRPERLIRDGFPQCIEADGRTAAVRALDSRAIGPYLAHKLLEETPKRTSHCAATSARPSPTNSPTSWRCSNASSNWARWTGTPSAPARPRRPPAAAAARTISSCKCRRTTAGACTSARAVRCYTPWATRWARGAHIRLLTTDYLDITEPDALTQLIALPGDVDVRLYSEPGRSFHPKAYLFEHEQPEPVRARTPSTPAPRSASG